MTAIIFIDVSQFLRCFSLVLKVNGWVAPGSGSSPTVKESFFHDVHLLALFLGTLKTVNYRPPPRYWETRYTFPYKTVRPIYYSHLRWEDGNVCHSRSQPTKFKNVYSLLKLFLIFACYNNNCCLLIYVVH